MRRQKNNSNKNKILNNIIIYGINMREYEFMAEVQDIDGPKCRLIIPLDISKSFDADIWFIDELQIDGKIHKGKSISRNMRKYYYILIDKQDIPKNKFVKVKMRV